MESDCRMEDSARSHGGDWILLFHGVSDNRTGVLGPAELLLRHGYNVVMMDSRAHGESGGDMATYGWKERYDTVAITNALYSTEMCAPGGVGCFDGRSIALQAQPWSQESAVVIGRKHPFGGFERGELRLRRSVLETAPGY